MASVPVVMQQVGYVEIAQAKNRSHGLTERVRQADLLRAVELASERRPHDPAAGRGSEVRRDDRDPMKPLEDRRKPVRRLVAWRPASGE
jgi:hypothetical protein